MKESVGVTILSHPKYLVVARAVTVAMATLHGMSEQGREEVRLAVDEALANVIRHAYQGDHEQRIDIRYSLADSFEVVIEDHGIPVQTEAFQGRELDQVRPGGLGIHFIRRAFDTFTLDREERGGNRLTLIRQRRLDDADRSH